MKMSLFFVQKYYRTFIKTYLYCKNKNGYNFTDNTFS